jgi:hypothetical protein
MNNIGVRPPQLAEGTVSEHRKKPSAPTRRPVTNVYRPNTLEKGVPAIKNGTRLFG